eukprot:scaffold28306_cov24-Tisochrysis_lutea.AAC.1
MLAVPCCPWQSSDDTESIVAAFQNSINGPRAKILDPIAFCVEDMAGNHVTCEDIGCSMCLKKPFHPWSTNEASVEEDGFPFCTCSA